MAHFGKALMVARTIVGGTLKSGNSDQVLIKELGELRAAPFSDAMVLDVRDPAELEKVGAVGAARRCAATIATDACAHGVGPAEAEHTQGKA